MLRAQIVGIGALLLASCGAAPATPDQQEQAEQRLLAPFLAQREVGCDALLVELTGNFDPNVARPAVDPQRHEYKREVADGYIDHVWLNRSGLPDSAFKITIGATPELTDKGWKPGLATRFTVVNRLVVRVFEGRHELTLRASTTGDYAVVRDGTQPMREVRRIVIPDDVPARP